MLTILLYTVRILFHKYTKGSGSVFTVVFLCSSVHLQTKLKPIRIFVDFSNSVLYMYIRRLQLFQFIRQMAVHSVQPSLNYFSHLLM